MDIMERAYTETEGLLTYVLDTETEWMQPDWEMTAEEIEEFWRRVSDGSLLWFYARVQCIVEDMVLGEAYLGGCAYESIEQFVQDGYYSDMKNNAKAEAVEKIRALAEVLAEIDS